MDLQKLNANCPDSEKTGTGPGSCGGATKEKNTENNIKTIDKSNNVFSSKTNGYDQGKKVDVDLYSNIPIDSRNMYHPINDRDNDNVAWAEVKYRPDGKFLVHYDIASGKKDQIVSSAGQAKKLATSYINSKKAVNKDDIKKVIPAEKPTKPHPADKMNIDQLAKALGIHEDQVDAMKDQYSHLHEDSRDNMVESKLREMYKARNK
jgi:hypothetical protein